ncbi:UDP-glucose dehydrogenase family protein [Rickettsiales endosymbiont of Stachyamoeba lipophora]|uniref:UDP-glucose dehydrogenase family protein n=1 Tax=Rickettsiales endosymbiont of Stachyamoeba lipophora TaxID=2486578 RepID=UPI000F652424|nr:UDP-glucose/GDP-mannose dehydrogenase family protein [Rickettsiales endosymbiont of Stachyamoeba lipophora]AZL15401.1 UDP-glucose/GDP-mannose dehydrogenase family protein [Rickettsiales endosymbiont of Stachyamoeba lipophora]
MKVAIIGVGYVGLVTGVGLAELGHHVTCIDIDPHKITDLNQNIIPIYEPGLEELVVKNKERLNFTTDYSLIKDAEIIMIAVGTPTDPVTDEADLKYVKAAFQQICNELKDSLEKKLIVIKSTVPVGTNKMLVKDLKLNACYELASNPEFLREGSALEDFFNPDRIVVGVYSIFGAEILKNLYAKFIEQKVPLLVMDPLSSEMCKYAANSFLAMKIGFANEVARLADKIGANAENVLAGLKDDHRIGKYFLNPGPGFGGSCFPKDCLEMQQLVVKSKVDAPLISNILKTNEQQKQYVVEVIEKLIPNNHKILVLGMSFKANTDDIRDSTTLYMVPKLISQGYNIDIYDPLFQNKFKQQQLDWKVAWLENLDGLLEYQAIIILTEWQEFKIIKNYPLSPQVKLIDFRNIFDPNEMRETKIDYYPVGRMNLYEY